MLHNEEFPPFAYRIVLGGFVRVVMCNNLLDYYNLISDKKEDKTMHEFAKAEKQPKEQGNPFISQLMGNMYPGIALFARDVNLLPGLAEK